MWGGGGKGAVTKSEQNGGLAVADAMILFSRVYCESEVPPPGFVKGCWSSV